MTDPLTDPPGLDPYSVGNVKGMATALQTVVNNPLQPVTMHVPTCWKHMPATLWITTMKWMTEPHQPQKLNCMLLVDALGQCRGRPNTEQHSHQKAFRLPGMHAQAVGTQLLVAVALDPHLHLPPGQTRLPREYPSPVTDPTCHRRHRQVTLPTVRAMQGLLTPGPPQARGQPSPLVSHHCILAPLHLLDPKQWSMTCC